VLIQETYMDVDRNVRFDQEPYEAYTDDVSRLFRSLQREHGRCTGRVYISAQQDNARRMVAAWGGEERHDHTQVKVGSILKKG
jgi:uncharacterized protein (DUF2461 family)